MDDLISRKAFLRHVENQHRQWGNDYDAEQILGDLEDFPPARQWIPWVENDDRLKNHYYYLVNHVGHEIPMLAKFHDDGCYFEIISLYPHKSIYVWDNDIITAWMPLPEIYKGDEDGV